MISEEVVTSGLSAICVAAAGLIEDHHDELVTTLPKSLSERRGLVERLSLLGADLQALARAGNVLLRRASES